VFKQFTDKAQTVITHDADDQAVELSIAGAHNIQNAALAVKVGLHFGIPLETIKAALKAFKGIERRFQTLGQINDTKIVCDFAHHPAEIQTTISTAREVFGDKFLIVFQPHTFTRTVALFDDFVKVLTSCDCILFKTYSAREKPIRGGEAYDIARAARKKYFGTQEALQSYISKVAPKYKAIILTGAGDIYKVLDKFVSLV
jgi:UDP-N-acetylmuramate--alanine ligase